VFTVTRTGDTTAALTVNYSVAGTATAGGDYTALSGSVTIPVGQASATITVAVLDDDSAEAAETVIATLIAGSHTIRNPSSATVTTPNASEPSTNGVFTVTRTGNTVAPLTVNYTVTGTATAGSDYTALSGSVTIPGGQASATITVAVLDDFVAEGPETVIVTL